MLVLSSSLSAMGQNAVCFYRSKPIRTAKKAPETPARSVDQYASNGVRRVAPRTEYADFEKVTAASVANGKGNGVVLEWEMAAETGNLGFFVYRDGKNGKELVSPDITVGSAGLVGTQPLYGQVYRVYDADGRMGDRYVVQALGPQGERVETDPITVTTGTETAVPASILQKAPPQNLETLYPVISSIENFKDAPQADLATHRWVVSQPGAKIGVRTEGLYRVRLSELQSAEPGIFSSGNVANWRLFKEGHEQAIITASDASGPYLEFYGTPIDTRESDTRVYYLIVDAAQPGLRMARQKVLATSTGTAVSYPAMVEKKERTTYIGTIFNDDAENWWGRPITSTATNVPVTLTGVDFTQPTAIVNVKLQGWSLTANQPSVRVTLNGNFLGDISTINYQVPFSAQFTVPTSMLVEGSNALGLTSNYGSNTELFDSVQVSYARKYQALQSRVAFSIPNGLQSVVTGFSGSHVRVLNLQNEDKPSLMGTIPVQQSGATFTATVPPIARNAGQKIFAVEDSGLLQAFSVTANNPSTLSSSIQNADMIIISYSAADFMAAAETWANYRRAQGFNVVVVDVADILDEYSYGSLSSFAVHDFLQYAHANWPSQVLNKQYVLLLGDASTNPRDYLVNGIDYGYWDQVPTMIVTTVYQETGSDEALADFDRDGLAEMAVGRIPFRTAAAVTTAFNKTVGFEANPALQQISRGTVFAYDVPNGYDFASMSQDLGSYLPAGTSKTFVPRGIEPTPPPPNNLAADPNAHTNLVAAINAGKYLVNYSGHGAQSIWSSTTFLSNTTVNTELTNAANPSIYTMLTCLNGYFIGHNGLNDDSIAELLLKSSNGGGPAAWASTGLTTADIQMVMGRRFMEQIGLGNIPRMGDLIRDAKGVIPAGADVRFSWALFGDPMLKVR